MTGRNDTVEIDVELKRETGDAYLFEHEWSNEFVWISKLSCTFDHTTNKVTLRENLAIEYGML